MQPAAKPVRTPLLALIGLAAVLRLVNVNAELWFDEIVSVIHFVGTPFSKAISSYGLANNHVLNSVLMNVVGASLGVSPWLLRLPAVLFGVAGVWAFWFVAAQLWPRLPALIGTGLFAVSYHHIYYSQNARGYSALIFFGLVSTGCLLRLLPESPPATRWPAVLGYTASVGVGLYAMLLMVFVVAGQGLVLLVLGRWQLVGALAAGLATAGILYAPMAASLVDYYTTHPGDTGYPLLSMDFARALAPLAPLLILASICTAPLLLRLWRRQPVAAAVLLAPVAFNVLVPLLRGQGVYPRSFIYGLPIAYLLLVEAIDWALTRRPLLGWVAAAAVVAASVLKLVPFYQLPKQGFRQALAYVEANRQAGDGRLGLTLGGKAARFYDDRYVLIEDASQLEAWIRNDGAPAWIVSTFPGAMRANEPNLYAWLQSSASERAEFPGVIGDGTVHVSYWPGSHASR